MLLLFVPLQPHQNHQLGPMSMCGGPPASGFPLCREGASGCRGAQTRVTHRGAAQHLLIVGPQCSSPNLPLCPMTKHPSGRAVEDRGIQRNQVLRTKGKGEIKMQSSSSPVELFCLHLESRHKGLILWISSFFPFHLCIARSPVKPFRPTALPTSSPSSCKAKPCL